VILYFYEEAHVSIWKNKLKLSQIFFPN